MDRPIRLVSLALVAGVLAACGTTDTELGSQFDPLNGATCSAGSPEKNGCVCAADERWLCAGQNSVECNNVYGSGGGRLLVSADMPCEMEWGWMTGCSDGRVYQAHCDGLTCRCSVDGAPGESWFTPRCTEMNEANVQCGWSLKFPDGAAVGNGPAQGHQCETIGVHDDETGCTCFETGWDCQGVAGCYISGQWAAGKTALNVTPYGTLLYSGAPGVDRADVLAQTGPGFVGTWELAAPYVYFRSTHSPAAPSCDGTFGTYELTFDEACGALSLTLIDDACAPRATALGAFHGSN